MARDKYVTEVIESGDLISNMFAAKLIGPTLKYNSNVKSFSSGMGGLNYAEIPEGWLAVVHSAGGDPRKTDLTDYGNSVVSRLVKQAEAIGAEPICISDVVDMQKADTELAEYLALAMAGAAKEYYVSFVNGEYAILKERVRDVNVSGTMISKIKQSELDLSPGDPISILKTDKDSYALFDAGNDVIFITSDGVGTKMKDYELLTLLKPAEILEIVNRPIEDFYGMTFDDLVKRRAKARVVSGVIETRGDIPVGGMEKYARKRAKELNALGIMQYENLGERISGFGKDGSAFNVGGSVVGTLSRRNISDPPKSGSGNYVIVLRSKNPNPRSNAMTARNEALDIIGKDWCEKYGVNEWWNTPEGGLFLEFVTTPSAILYPVFYKLLESGYATNVYHPSGGAFDGKLAKPLAKQGLIAYLDNLYAPDWRDITLGCALGTTAEDEYRKKTMGNDGIITTKNPIETIKMIESFNFEGKLAGRINKEGKRTGAVIKTFRMKDIPPKILSKKCENYVLQTFEGREVYYSGKN